MKHAKAITDKPATATATSAAPAREPIMVQVLRFDPSNPMDTAALSVASSCSASDQRNRQGHTISYLPWMRHFRLDFQDGHGAIRTSYVHETQVKSWDPIA